jgi:hypothetical protein
VIAKRIVVGWAGLRSGSLRQRLFRVGVPRGFVPHRRSARPRRICDYSFPVRASSVSIGIPGPSYEVVVVTGAPCFVQETAGSFIACSPG